MYQGPYANPSLLSLTLDLTNPSRRILLMSCQLWLYFSYQWTNQIQQKIKTSFITSYIHKHLWWKKN